MPVVGELLSAVGSRDRADLAWQALPGGGGAGRRGPVRGAAAVALGGGRGVGGERVERAALGVGQYRGAADRRGRQGGARGRGCRRAGSGQGEPEQHQCGDRRPAAVVAAARAAARGIRAGKVAGAAARRPAAGGGEREPASTTKAATSTRPAAMPAVVRTSLNPNSPSRPTAVAAEGGRREAGPRRRPAGWPAVRRPASGGWPAPPGRGRRPRSPAAGTATRSSGWSGTPSGPGQDGSRGGGQQPPARHPQHDPRPAARLPSGVLPPAPCRSPCRSGLVMLCRPVIRPSSGVPFSWVRFQ